MTRTRSALRWVAAASVGISLTVAAVPAQAAAPATSHLRAAAAPSTVLIGGSVVVTGAVSPSVAGSPVVLQRLVAGHWKTVTHHATGKGGSYSLSVRATGKPATWSLRVIRTGTSKAKGVIGKTLKVHLTRTAYQVTASAVTGVNEGQPVVLTGAVGPKTTGKVYLQTLRLGAWHTLAGATLTGSQYTFSVALAPGSYALRVLKPFNTKIATGQSRPMKVTVFPAPGTVPRPPTSPRLTLTSQDDAVLGLPGNRLVFSTVRSGGTPAKTFTFTNAGNAEATVSGLSIQGANASSFSLAPGQPTTFTVPAGGTATVSVVFNPTPATGCPTGTTYPDAYLIGDSVRQAALVYTTTDSGFPGGSATLGGVNSCNYSGNNEPVLDQVVSALGYTTVVDGPNADRRFIGQAPNISGTDEISAPYFRAANPAVPVTLTPLAQYSTTAVVPYHATGWFAQGATVGPDGTCNASCHQIWAFPGEGGAPDTSFVQNQRLLPVPTGTTSFTPVGAFGIYNGESTNVNFSDDILNVAHQCTPSPSDCRYDGTDITPARYLHNIRIYPAYGPGHVAIPSTYLVAIDVSRLADKNNDYQDVVMVLRNAVPSTS